MRFLLLLVVLLFAVRTWSQEVCCGTVESDGQPLPGAVVRWVTNEKAVETDGLGRFCLPVVQLPDTLEVHMIGFIPYRLALVQPVGDLVVQLEMSALELREAVITGLPAPVSTMNSPLRVDLVQRSFMDRIPVTGIAEILNYVNGIQESSNCGVCGTNELQVNGMDGPYTLVLIDGAPVMGALASVYGLSGIPASMIERVEIIRGPSSTAYGSEAVGGVINIVTRPAHAGSEFILESQYSSHDQLQANVGWSGRILPRTQVRLAGSLNRNALRLDDNADGFTDIPLADRYSGFLSWQHKGRWQWSGTSRWLSEDRWGGQISAPRDDRGSSEKYSESILTKRWENLLHVRNDQGWVADLSAVWHYQDSYYGVHPFVAEQRIAFLHLARSGSSGHHQWRAGSTFRASWLRDNALLPQPDVRMVPGIYLQDEWSIHERISVLGGMRVDLHTAHGVVWSPQMNVRYRPHPYTTIRLNSGTGFREVHLFAEDHSVMTGARRIVIEEALRPERSRAISMDVVHVFTTPNGHSGRVTAEVFHTRFQNRIVPDYLSDPEEVRYRNLSGHGIAQGFGAGYRHTFPSGVEVSGSGQHTGVWVMERAGRTPQLLTPVWTALAFVQVPFLSKWQFNWSCKWTGPMELPHYPEPWSRPSRSPVFAVHHIQGSYAAGEGKRLFVAVKNVLDHTQPSPLVAPSQPFGEAFDTTYVYGPLQGRHLVVGVNWTIFTQPHPHP